MSFNVTYVHDDICGTHKPPSCCFIIPSGCYHNNQSCGEFITKLVSCMIECVLAVSMYTVCCYYSLFMVHGKSRQSKRSLQHMHGQMICKLSAREKASCLLSVYCSLERGGGSGPSAPGPLLTSAASQLFLQETNLQSAHWCSCFTAVCINWIIWMWQHNVQC